MEAKHTPGPWATSPTATPERARQHAVYSESAETRGDVALAYTNEADANLIAAAPDLLAGCKDALRILTDDWCRGAITAEQDRKEASVALARVIARAEGR